MSKKNQNIELPLFYSELLDLVGSSSLSQIIENYFGVLGPVPLEKSLMEEFPPKDFISLGLSRYYPKVYRGLPRLYMKSSPFRSEIKKNFDHLPSLKKQALSKALFSLYNKMPASGKVTILTWVMNDGLGDFVAATEVMRILKARLNLDIHLIALIPEKATPTLHFPPNSLILPYKDEAPLIPFEAFSLLAESNLILEMPTFYPHTNLIKAALPHTRWEIVGEYGFVESSWFHPRSGNHCLGLHFLEKGILTRKPCVASWDDVQNEKLKSWKEAQNHFYLAYLSTPVGGAIYLHSLLKSLENDPQNIDICVPDLGWFIAFAEKQMKMKRPILQWDMGVSVIEIYFEDKYSRIEIAPQGKNVRLLCPGRISQSDFRALLALSGDWVAIRGNQSFSEAVSQRKAFFYDGREHSRYFLKDFAAIAENRIGNFPSTLECIRGMLQGFLYNVSVQEGAMVDETYFQELEDWPAIALRIGLALQDSDTVSGFRKLGAILTDEFSANSFLCHLVQRALCHHNHPYVEQLEASNLDKFVRGEFGFKEFVEAQSLVIETCQKNISRE